MNLGHKQPLPPPPPAALGQPILYMEALKLIQIASLSLMGKCVRGGRGPVCPTISTKGQSSPQPRAAEPRRGQSPNHVGRKGATISANEAGGLKAFYLEAARPPREQTVLLPWLPGTPGRKGFGDRRRGGGLEKAWREKKERGRARDGSRRGWCWLGGFLSSIPLPTPPPPKTNPRTLGLHPPLPHSGHWPITPFNALDPSSWKQSKQHALECLIEHLRAHKLN